eukprot:ANDGO_02721.mRNA.1 transmembrane protein 17
MLHGATSLQKSFSGQSNKSRSLRPINTEINSSVNFQLLMYMHSYYCAMMIVLSIFTIAWRSRYYSWPLWQDALHSLLFAIWCIAEIGRLYLGFTGNLGERVPSMVGFVLLSVFPQILTYVYLTVIQFDMTPLDRAMIQLSWAFWVAEVIWGYRTVRKLLRCQSAKYYLHFDKEGQLVR